MRPLHALPVGLRWSPRPGFSLIGDAAHLMSPLSGEGVNLALADAVDLTEALTSADPDAVATFEERMAARAEEAAEGAAAGLESVMSHEGAASVLEHNLERAAS